ncbi:extracellular solute-binding protein [Paenibacillaceae bacterium]|nr:extracellular solute-binding protein [Paenibacillaceae bacterium]
MRKRSLTVLCLFVIVLLLAACGGGNNPDDSGVKNEPKPPEKTENTDPPKKEDPPAEAPPEKVTISVYYPTPDQPENRALEDDKIARFIGAYPNVEIVKSDWHYKTEEIGIKMAANEAPTMFNAWATEGRFLVERGWAADITEFVNAWEFKDQMNPILQEQFLFDGKVYGLAQNGYVVGTVVNKKMLEAASVALPPYDWTWEDMYQTAAAITDTKKGISGIAPMGVGNEAGWNWTNFLFLAGGEVHTLADGKVTAAFNSDAGLKALEFYHKLRWEANAIPQDWALNWGDAVGTFAQGRTAMVMAGANDPVDQALNQGDFVPEDILVYPMPAYQKGGEHAGVLGGNFLVVNPNASKAEQEMAFKYMVFDYFSDAGLNAIEKNIQERKAEGSYFVPPVAEYFQMESEYGQRVKAIYDKYDNVYEFDVNVLKLLEGKPEAQFSTQDFYGIMTNVIQAVFSKKDTDLKAALDEAAQQVQSEYYDQIKVEN